MFQSKRIIYSYRNPFYCRNQLPQRQIPHSSRGLRQNFYTRSLYSHKLSHKHAGNKNNFDQGIQFLDPSFIHESIPHHSQFQSNLFPSKQIKAKDTLRCIQSLSPNFTRCKSEMVRSQSLNEIYKNQRIHMLSKMNSFLANHSQNRIVQMIEPNPQQQNKAKLHQHLSQKIDRLEGYLKKIKKQRQKQQIPKKNAKFEIKKKTFVEQTKIQKQIIKSHPLQPLKKPQSQVKNIFSELEKIKKQIQSIRQEAVIIKNKNSISRQKYVSLGNKNSFEKEFTEVKKEFSKIDNLRLIRPEKTTSSRNQQYPTTKLELNATINKKYDTNYKNFPQNLRQNNHMIFNQRQGLSNLSSQMQSRQTFQNQKILPNKTPSKLKIIFSFGQKK